MRVLLMLNGQPPSVELTQHCTRLSELVVAADNGARHLLDAGVEPNLIVGDIDSLSPDLATMYQQCLCKVETQENTDLEKSLTAIISAYPSAHVTILGGTGRRLDHELGNFLCAATWADRLSLRIVSDSESVYFPRAAQTLKVHTAIGQTVSLFGLPQAEGVCTSGLRWPLCDELLPMGTRGVSNETTEDHITVSFRAGRLVVVLAHSGWGGIDKEW
ncbi:MAG: thiamine diphosphokinase [Armatimonadota bacterium]